jgi:vacuolar protein sorting-associated protein 13D
MRNETGSDLVFTTSVEESIKARLSGQKSNAKWFKGKLVFIDTLILQFSALADRCCTFEFPTKLLTTRDPHKETRQLIIRVDGWEEISPVSVDSVGTYIRLTRRDDSAQISTYARLVIDVSMEPNGRKVVIVRSAMTIVNKLADPIRLIFTDPSVTKEICVRPGVKMFAPLAHVNSRIKVCPFELESVVGALEIKWQRVTTSGDVENSLICFRSEEKDTHLQYWLVLN